ncbi:DNA-binding transcriptional regulator, AcrR family [Saccharopolyspora antimicrobica]|uniref:DNA-binding transcriptional regulator, AcrR family n=1 Tax=Saccharopolyspora antimicrobica TaxID=455193 RepID=A0A1I5F586_9PSEU|nr:TetR/AcrR family transcriptional regulator [Saccharopolyspora antimicrobica]RKT83685.1 TetR family transcriptional regulator [Saccharopolyspora antimicrobica]SFO18853.1 DNA-binding transcriptional regulator, AcrR family [Saccharopolyspora antimicrobica]
MTSQCHSSLPRHSARSAPNRVGEAELLHAARECVLANGVRRTTLTEIARRAGVSRMTLYRRFPDVDSVVTALMTVEFGEILDMARAAERTGNVRQRLVSATVHGVRLLQTAPLLQRVVEADAELLLPYLVQRLGSTQLAAEGFLREYLVDGHADGSIRPGDPAVQARSLLLLVQSFVVTAGPATSDIDPDDLAAELTKLLDGALRP